MLNQYKPLIVLAVLLFVLLSACSNQPQAEPVQQPSQASEDSSQPAAPVVQPPAAPKPVTLTMLMGNSFNDTEFNLMFTEPVSKKHPHITLQRTSTTKIDELIVSGQTPDIILTHNGNLGTFELLDLLFDITPLAKQQQVDLGSFHKLSLEALAFTGPGQLNGLPYAINFGAMYYNKDIFDKFGVPYPTDGMTWDDAIEHGKKVTRTDNGVNIRGFDPYALTRLQRIVGNTFYNPAANQSTLNTPEWKSILEQLKGIITLPGNEWTDAEVKNGLSPEANFHTRRISAMYAGNNLTPQLQKPSEQGLNWNVVQYPSHPARPNVYNDVDAHLAFITSTTPHKDDAMRVLAVLTSHETQMTMTRQTARMSPLLAADLKQAFAADMPFAQGKNHAGVFKSDMALSPFRPTHFTQASNIIKAAFYEYVHGKDVNTALREADEKLNQHLIAESKK